MSVHYLIKHEIAIWETQSVVFEISVTLIKFLMQTSEEVVLGHCLAGIQTFTPGSMKNRSEHPS